MTLQRSERRRDSRRRFAWVIFLAALLPSIEACRPAETVPLPDILLVVMDTTRFDDWSFLEPARRTTPVLERLAARGFRFTSAYSLYTVTVPSHVSLFTGREAVFDTPASRAAAGSDEGAGPRDTSGYVESSLFTILGRRGYRTYSFSGNKNVTRSNIAALENVHVTDEDLHTGMSESDVAALLRRYGEAVEPPESLSPDARRAFERNRRVIRGSAEQVNRAAVAAMEAHARERAGEPYFLFVNYNDAHDPYFPEAPYDQRFATPGASDFNGNLWDPARRHAPTQLRGAALSMTADGLSAGDIARALDLHRGELSYADRHLGQLLGELGRLGLLRSTIIVAVSDHGELFGENGRMAHAGEAVEELVHVPMVMLLPELSPGAATIDARVDLRDVKPTLLDYLGIDDVSSQGRSLMPVLRDGAAALRPPVEPSTPADGTNVIGGQDDATTENLIRELRSLGYID